jgi:hypothetical protein
MAVVLVLLLVELVLFMMVLVRLWGGGNDVDCGRGGFDDGFAQECGVLAVVFLLVMVVLMLVMV